MKNSKYSILIPTYNEADIIDHALKQIAMELGSEITAATEIIIVDDGTDGLPQVIEQNKSDYKYTEVKVLRNHPPVGKGQSLALGFALATGDVVGFLDVDLSTPPRYIKMALESILSGQDVFIGSRRSVGSSVNREQFFLKDVLGTLLGFFARKIIFGSQRNYADTQCGFKFYKNGVAKTLYKNLSATDGLNDLEVLIRANLMGYRVQEQGVEWTDLRESKRSLRRILWGEIVAICRIIIKYRVFGSKQKRALKKQALTQGASDYTAVPKI